MFNPPIPSYRRAGISFTSFIILIAASQASSESAPISNHNQRTRPIQLTGRMLLAAITRIFPIYLGQGGGAVHLLSPPASSHTAAQEITIEGTDLMGKDKTPPDITIGGRMCEVIPFYSGRAQIVCIAPAYLVRSWKRIQLVTAAGQHPTCHANHDCHVHFAAFQPHIARILNPEIHATDVVGVYFSNSQGGDSIPSEMVMKLGDTRCRSFDQSGEQTVAEQYADVWYSAQVANSRRRAGSSTNWMAHRAFCELFSRHVRLSEFGWYRQRIGSCIASIGPTKCVCVLS